MFSPHCHHCGRSPVHKIIWPWLKRYCAKCLPRMAIRPSDIAILIATGRVYVGPSDLPVIYNLRDREGPERYHALQVEHFEQQWRDAGDAPETYAKLYEGQKTHVRAVTKFAEELQDWSRGERFRREEESREQRFASVLRRLKTVGWGPELEFHELRIRTDREGPAQVLSGWGMASNVTNKEWLELYDSMKDYMAKLRRIRRSEQTLAVFRRIDDIVAAHHTGSTPAGQAFPLPTMRGPTAIDIAWMTEGADLILYDPGDMSAVNAYLTSLAFRVPQLIALWEERFKDQLRERVHLLCPYIPPDIDPLDLAIAAFGCLKCDLRSTTLQEPALALRYPDILTHPCFYEYDERSPAKWPLPIDHEYQETIRTLELGAQHPRCPIVPGMISMAAAWRVHVALVKIRWDPAVVLFSDMHA